MECLHDLIGYTANLTIKRKQGLFLQSKKVLSN